MSTWKNILYFGDNLDILQRLSAEHPQGVIDLIYLDPPFNSKRNYNILFEDVDMTDTKAQVTTPMQREAAQQGCYHLRDYPTQFPKIQILTVEQLLNGEGVKMPYSTEGVFKRAPQQRPDSTQEDLL
ncbi:hypothetical protein GF339_13235 [candidate division KSB3 bacterium]|uniref:DNA methylase N-4/N-6 domain-containing protein n=1 Tax=candidate division KSB3 bacterium TaxID=2044937 RepID=A0A9D5JWR8_9BACT|nr:hypothetical protein [candidate division KSB3 bacterium]MBD3325548.1 hypothetical protein [candidate division KSB3 bacterium]